MTLPAKVLWHSNAPHTPTGYGKQTALFAPLLAERTDLYLSANYGLEGAPLAWGGIPVLPGLGSTHGNEAIPGHVNAVFDDPREGLVLTLYDTPPFDAQIFKRLNAVCWTPVDHEPASPLTITFFRESAAIPLALSRFGEEMLAEFDPIYVPHGVNVEVFKEGPNEVRAEMGLDDDAFLIGMVAANKGRTPSRKCFQQALEAFRYFHRRHENAVLYCHTTLSAHFAGGEDIASLAASLDVPEESLKYPNQYSMIFSPMADRKMAEIYSSMDVLLNCSMGEGFGVPIIEAAACGTPSIVTDFSAMPEVAGPEGWLVKGRGWWTGQHSWMAVPDVGEMVDALEECYALTDEERAAKSRACREHALGYSHVRVFEERMLPALAEVEERFGSRLPLELAA